MALESVLRTRCEPTPRVGVATPSSLPSEISSDRASSTELLVIIYHPSRLARATHTRLMGHPHAGDLAGVKPWRVVCMIGDLRNEGEGLSLKREGVVVAMVGGDTSNSSL